MKDQKPDFSSNNNLPAGLERRLAETSEDERVAIEKTWDLALFSQLVDEEAVPDLDALWQNLAPQLDKPISRYEQNRGPVQRSRRTGRWRRFNYIAVAATVLALCVGMYWLSVPQTFTAANGERLLVSLPDGSSVELNSGSQLQYRRPFLGWTRKVHLEGEAFFDVEKKARTFVVETFNASVSVLGTTFNVRAWEDESSPETAVILVTGSVELASLSMPGQPVILRPGEISRVQAGSGLPSAPLAVNDPESVWRTGGLSFDALPLIDILKELERQYGLRITVAQPAMQEELTLFLESKPPIETVLDLICNSMSCRFEFVPDGYRISLIENQND